jgi:hypothetical protein
LEPREFFPKTVDPDALRDKSIEVLLDLTKQMITLSTGFIALTITFRKDILGATHHGQTAILGAAWISFILCIVGGLLLLMALAGNLGSAAIHSDPAVRSDQSPSVATVFARNIRVFLLVQAFLFVVGVALSVVYGFTSLYS